jgi:SAM-dependent methyltransferase
MQIEPEQSSHPNVDSHAGAEFFCQQLRDLDPGVSNAKTRILVAGCGAGHEAALIQRLLSAEVQAVDAVDELSDHFRAWSGLHYQVASVCDLPFEEGYFDAVFYHHVIEHVDDPAGSLVELSRVLKPGGWIFIGTPNRHRLVSSVGAHKQTQWKPTWRNKLHDNLNAWSARLRGRFRNEFGAHAGFSRRELSGLLKQTFDQQRWVTKSYLQRKYLNHRFAPAVSLFATPPLQNFGVPSIYVFACNRATTAV